MCPQSKAVRLPRSKSRFGVSQGSGGSAKSHQEPSQAPSTSSRPPSQAPSANASPELLLSGLSTRLVADLNPDSDSPPGGISIPVRAADAHIERDARLMPSQHAAAEPPPMPGGLRNRASTVQAAAEASAGAMQSQDEPGDSTLAAPKGKPAELVPQGPDQPPPPAPAQAPRDPTAPQRNRERRSKAHKKDKHRKRSKQHSAAASPLAPAGQDPALGQQGQDQPPQPQPDAFSQPAKKPRSTPSAVSADRSKHSLGLHGGPTPVSNRSPIVSKPISSSVSKPATGSKPAGGSSAGEAGKAPSLFRDIYGEASDEPSPMHDGPSDPLPQPLGQAPVTMATKPAEPAQAPMQPPMPATDAATPAENPQRGRSHQVPSTLEHPGSALARLQRPPHQASPQREDAGSALKRLQSQPAKPESWAPVLWHEQLSARLNASAKARLGELPTQAAQPPVPPREEAAAAEQSTAQGQAAGQRSGPAADDVPGGAPNIVPDQRQTGSEGRHRPGDHRGSTAPRMRSRSPRHGHGSKRCVPDPAT